MKRTAVISRRRGSMAGDSSPKWLRTSTSDAGGTTETDNARLNETGFHASVQVRCRTDGRQHRLVRSVCSAATLM